MHVRPSLLQKHEPFWIRTYLSKASYLFLISFVGSITITSKNRDCFAFPWKNCSPNKAIFVFKHPCPNDMSVTCNSARTGERRKGKLAFFSQFRLLLCFLTFEIYIAKCELHFDLFFVLLSGAVFSSYTKRETRASVSSRCNAMFLKLMLLSLSLSAFSLSVCLSVRLSVLLLSRIRCFVRSAKMRNLEKKKKNCFMIAFVGLCATRMVSRVTVKTPRNYFLIDFIN